MATDNKDAAGGPTRPQRWIVKLNGSGCQYLKDDVQTIDECGCPQWYWRKSARVFASADEARARLDEVRKQWPKAGDYDGRPVRIISRAEGKAKAAAEALRAAADALITDRDSSDSPFMRFGFNRSRERLIERADALWPGRGRGRGRGR